MRPDVSTLCTRIHSQLVRTIRCRPLPRRGLYNPAEKGCDGIAWRKMYMYIGVRKTHNAQRDADEILSGSAQSPAISQSQQYTVFSYVPEHFNVLQC